jgi:UDP-2,3-diacylglucosamine hydrolase
MILRSFSSISDLHIEKINDDAYKTLEKFIKISIDNNVEAVIFLGDIFDVFAGNHKEYLIEFAAFFEKIDKLLKNKIKVIYFEGNHDFHLNELFKTTFKQEYDELFFYVKRSLVIQCDNKKILLDHGDNIQPGSFNYFVFKKLMTSDAMELVVNRYLNFEMIKKIGSKASSSSARYSRVINESEVREKFRTEAIRHCATDIDAVIMGHSHVLENFEFKVNKTVKKYLNNGFAPKTKSFVLAINGSIQLQSIESVPLI